MKTKHIIYDSYDTYSEENVKNVIKTYLENDNTKTRDDIPDGILEDMCYESNQDWFECELEELERVDIGNGIIAIADVGTWHGRFVGHKELKNLKDILYSNDDYECVYVDNNGDIRKDSTNHDATTHVLYRYWKDNISDVQKENFKNKCYQGTVKQSDITRYTKKCGLEISKSYGWKVKGLL